MLVAAAVVQGSVQAVAGGLIITGHATVWALAVLALVYGLADGFVIPTSQGLIPAIVSSTRLQQANALLGLSRSIVGVLGPALGGVLVAVGSPGSALLVDAASFGLAAALLFRVSLPAARRRSSPSRSWPSFGEGWNEFRRQTWIWTTIVFFGIGNCASTSLFVLGPLVAKEHYSGASTWALLSAPSAPARSSAASSPCTFIPGGRCLRHASPRCRSRSSRSRSPCTCRWRCSSRSAALAGIGLAIHLALWFTVFQSNVPEAALSRVSSYDALGSFVLMPLGSIVAGPIASVIGITETLIATTVIELACFAVIIAQPSVWAIRAAPSAEPVLA